MGATICLMVAAFMAGALTAAQYIFIRYRIIRIEAGFTWYGTARRRPRGETWRRHERIYEERVTGTCALKLWIPKVEDRNWNGGPIGHVLDMHESVYLQKNGIGDLHTLADNRQN